MKDVYDSKTPFINFCITGHNYDFTDEALERSIACFAVSLENRGNEVRSRHSEKLQSFGYISAAVCLKEMDNAMAIRV